MTAKKNYFTRTRNYGPAKTAGTTNNPSHQAAFMKGCAGVSNAKISRQTGGDEVIQPQVRKDTRPLRKV